MSPIAPDITNIRASLHQHLMPPTKHRPVQWLIKGSVKIHHHLRDALFGGRYSAIIGLESELSPERRLNAVAVQDFPLDRGSLDGFVTDQLDAQLLTSAGIQVLDQSRNQSG